MNAKSTPIYDMARFKPPFEIDHVDAITGSHKPVKQVIYKHKFSPSKPALLQCQNWASIFIFLSMFLLKIALNVKIKGFFFAISSTKHAAKKL